MRYELALELKKAGYPLKVHITGEHGSDRFCAELGDDSNYYSIPTLEELIEACKDERGGVTITVFNTWCHAQKYTKDGEVNVDGITPIDTMVRLWIALNGDN